MQCSSTLLDGTGALVSTMAPVYWERLENMEASCQSSITDVKNVKNITLIRILNFQNKTTDTNSYFVIRELLLVVTYYLYLI